MMIYVYNINTISNFTLYGIKFHCVNSIVWCEEDKAVTCIYPQCEKNCFHAKCFFFKFSTIYIKRLIDSQISLTFLQIKKEIKSVKEQSVFEKFLLRKSILKKHFLTIQKFISFYVDIFLGEFFFNCFNAFFWC